VAYPAGTVLWYARVANAHSIELLPHDRIVVASSVGSKGNRLVLFDVAHSDQPIFDIALPSAHGVIWDEQRKRLWALGFDELRSYDLKDWVTDKPSFHQLASYPLPDSDGHDLQAVPSSKDLVVTTGQAVQLFDRENGKFRLHPELGKKAEVKCVSMQASSGRIVFVQATADHWWSDKLGFLSPASELPLESEKVYKTRWFSYVKTAER
jgi:streptogramin lyase